MKNQTINNLLLLMIAGLFCAACGSTSSKAGAKLQEHWAEVNNPALGVLYVDQADPFRVMQVIDSGNTTFIAYKVGLRDLNGQLNNKQKQERGKYLQYDLPRDWSLRVQRDSFAPVFFQPVVKTIEQEDEGILVFEIPSGLNPDTLIYHDSFGGWGIQKIILSGL